MPCQNRQKSSSSGNKNMCTHTHTQDSFMQQVHVRHQCCCPFRMIQDSSQAPAIFIFFNWNTKQSTKLLPAQDKSRRRCYFQSKSGKCLQNPLKAKKMDVQLQDWHFLHVYGGERASFMAWHTFKAQSLWFECTSSQQNAELLILAVRGKSGTKRHCRDGNESCHELIEAKRWSVGFEEL